MGGAYAAALLVLYGGYTLALLIVAGLGLWLLRHPARRRAGIALLGLLVVWCVGPPLFDRANAVAERRAINAATLMPDTLSFEGQRVLIIEASSTICSDFCGDLIRLGVPGEFYWIGIGNYLGGEDRPNPDFEIFNAGDEILHVELGQPVADLGGMRLAEPVAGAEIPPFDVVIIDDNGYLRSYAPQMLDLPEALVARTQIARVLLEDWRNPLSDPPPLPTYRTVSPWQDVGTFVYWPLSVEPMASTSIQQTEEAWTALMCDAAGPPDARDAFQFAYLCDQSQLDVVLSGDG